MHILVTGGIGYIGSHIVIELVKKKYNVVIVDNLSNSKIDTLESIYSLVDKNKIRFIKGNILNNELLENIFCNIDFDAVIHLAAFKSVSESIMQPCEYYENNITGTIKLLKICEKYNVKNFIFSSSATVYGNTPAPFYEYSETGKGITNPYGKTKYLCEELIKDYCEFSKKIKCIILRYFNPVGCHNSGKIGDDPNGIPNNLMPYILRVAKKNNLDSTMSDSYSKLSVYGNNYNTPDGTCLRDFIHVVDLANAHVKSLLYLNETQKNISIFNIGQGKGVSVKELIHAFIKYNEVTLPYTTCQKRDGDIEKSYCNSDKAQKELNWKPEHTLKDIVKDSWKYIISNYHDKIK